MAKHYTEEEIKNNYEFKVIVRLLKREFPFIKDVNFKHNEEINKWNDSIYINLDIDPFILSHMYGLPLWKVIVDYLRRGESYWTPYISIFLDGNDRVRDAEPINRAIEGLIMGVHRSPAIPEELKLGKLIIVGSYEADPSTVPPYLT